MFAYITLVYFRHVYFTEALFYKDTAENGGRFVENMIMKKDVHCVIIKMLIICLACSLYSNLTARWSNGTGVRVSAGSLTEVVEFPWMV